MFDQSPNFELRASDGNGWHHPLTSEDDQLSVCAMLIQVIQRERTTATSIRNLLIIEEDRGIAESGWQR